MPSFPRNRKLPRPAVTATAAAATAGTIAAAFIAAAAIADVPDAPAFASRAPAVTLMRSGAAEVVYRWKKQRCTPATVPDAAARAFRGANGNIRLLATSSENWSMVGPSFDHLRVDCHALWRSGQNADPAQFDDSSSIQATYVLPDQTVVALASNEWSAYRHREEGAWPAVNCRDPLNDACSMYSITQIVSHDGGNSFRYGAGNHLAATLPYRFNPQPGQTASTGMITVSNIISRDNFFYAYVAVRGAGAQKSGSCLMRTATLLQPQSWRAWNGADFDVEFADPYGAEPIAPEEHLCAPVASDDVQSIQYLEDFQIYVGLFRGWGKSEEGRLLPGIFYATTPDLIRWSQWELLMEIPAEKDCRESIFYPSMIADDDSTPNFEGAGGHPYLYYVRFNGRRCKPTLDRDLVRVPLEVQQAPRSQPMKRGERPLNADAMH